MLERNVLAGVDGTLLYRFINITYGLLPYVLHSFHHYLLHISRMVS